MNYTVEKEDGATSEMSSGPLPPSTESFVIWNATLGATYTITVSTLNLLGQGTVLTVQKSGTVHYVTYSNNNYYVHAECVKSTNETFCKLFTSINWPLK